VRDEVALAGVRLALRNQLLGFVAVALLTLLLVIITSRALLTPIRKLTGHAMALGRGNLGQRVHINSGDELEELGRTFNRMAEQITRQQEDIQAQTRHCGYRMRS